VIAVNEKKQCSTLIPDSQHNFFKVYYPMFQKQFLSFIQLSLLIDIYCRNNDANTATLFMSADF